MDQNNSTTNKRRWKQILEKERYQIESLLKAGLTPLLIGIQMDRDSRSIEWEIKRESNSSLTKEIRYCADVGQRVHEECAANKGRCLKIGKDHKLVSHIEKKIKDEKYSPDAVIGEIKEKGFVFESYICTKTLYNYIDKGLFLKY
ncbi:Transposase, IS30 family [Sporanaerobacter sp. PP17-6a]|jgi:IS30 family transposase|nr:Transposase, IS30 family [Sporanaerobacter sp. PP17-6a]